MKTNINITIDTEVLHEMKGRGINLSGLINEYLKGYLREDTPISIGEDIEELEKKKRELLEKKRELEEKTKEEEKKNIEIRLEEEREKKELEEREKKNDEFKKRFAKRWEEIARAKGDIK